MTQYYYLISSLPMLRQGEEPLFDHYQFLEDCRNWLGKTEFSILEKLSLLPTESSAASGNSLAAAWYRWETCLRNRIARTRKSAFTAEAEDYTLPEEDFFSEVERGVQDAFALSNPLEREKLLDALRWTLIENLEAGHIFDFDRLCAYKLKLMLVEKWQGREQEKGVAGLDKVVDEIYITQDQTVVE
jgi:hypothetical protein